MLGDTAIVLAYTPAYFFPTKKKRLRISILILHFAIYTAVILNWPNPTLFMSFVCLPRLANACVNNQVSFSLYE